MQKQISNFTIKADANASLITVYKDGQLRKGIACSPGELDDKFDAIAKSIVKHVENC